MILGNRTFRLTTPTKLKFRSRYSSIACGLCALVLLNVIFMDTSSNKIVSLPPLPPVKEVDPAFNLTMDPNKKLILLLTPYRGGSTFMGQIFDNNPEMQYHFEPFYDQAIREMYERGHIIGARPDHTEADLRMLYLQQILHNCTVYPTWFAEKYEFCGTPEENLLRYNKTECDTSYYKRQFTPSQICNLRKVIVVKVIRQKLLKDIFKIAQIRTANVKIIHLLRHPIPMMMSRRTGLVFFGMDRKTQVEVVPQRHPQNKIRLGWESHDYCTSNIESIRLTTQIPWLRRVYMRVTHREMSLQPLEVTSRIYKFIEEPLSENLKNFMKRMVSPSLKDIEENKQFGGLETFKNSTEIVDKWKNLISDLIKYDDLAMIEGQCGRVLEYVRAENFRDGISAGQFRRLEMVPYV